MEQHVELCRNKTGSGSQEEALRIHGSAELGKRSQLEFVFVAAWSVEEGDDTAEWLSVGKMHQQVACTTVYLSNTKRNIWSVTTVSLIWVSCYISLCKYPMPVTVMPNFCADVVLLPWDKQNVVYSSVSSGKYSDTPYWETENYRAPSFSSQRRNRDVQSQW